MIRRAPRPTTSFVIVRNEVARDRRLSYRARGLLVAILSRPDDWTVRAEHLASETDGEGRDAIRTALSELESAGYLTRTRLQDAEGKWYWESLVYDLPRCDPSPENPSTDNQKSDNQKSDSQASKEEPTRTTEKKDLSSSRRGEEVRRVFEVWVESTGKDASRTILDDRRVRRIEWALKNYPIEEVEAAVTGWARSPWHSGSNPSAKVYNELTLILKDAASLERFRDMIAPPPAPEPAVAKPVAPVEIATYCGKCLNGYVRKSFDGREVMDLCSCVAVS